MQAFGAHKSEAQGSGKKPRLAWKVYGSTGTSLVRASANNFVEPSD